MIHSNVLRSSIFFGVLACASLCTACTGTQDPEGTASDDGTSLPTTGDAGTGASTGATDGASTGATDVADSSGSSGASDGSSGAAADTGDSSTGEVVCGDPVELGVFTPSDGNARGFEVVGDTVYLAAESGGLAIVDLSDPTAPSEVAILDLGPGLLVHRIAVSGTTVYAGLRGSGWAAIDVTDPSVPALLSHEPDVSGQDVAVADDVLYVADVNGVQVFDVADPAAPIALVQDLVLPGSTQTVSVAGDYAYATGLTAGLSILDVADPAATTEVTTLDMDGRGYLAVAGDRAYVSASDGVHIVDIADPTAPIELGVFATDRPHGLAADDRLWVLGEDTVSVSVPMLQIVDVEDGAAPLAVFAGFDDFAAPAWIEVSEGRLLFSEEDDDALHVLDGCPQ